MLHLDAGNPAGAREALAQAERAGANARSLRLAQVRVLRTEGDYAGAERAVNELLASDPSDAAARNLLAAIAHDRTALRPSAH
jgi:Flp pilus assembly protein TadD